MRNKISFEEVLPRSTKDLSDSFWRAHRKQHNRHSVLGSEPKGASAWTQQVRKEGSQTVPLTGSLQPGAPPGCGSVNSLLTEQEHAGPEGQISIWGCLPQSFCSFHFTKFSLRTGKDQAQNLRAIFCDSLSRLHLPVTRQKGKVKVVNSAFHTVGLCPICWVTESNQHISIDTF